MNRPHTPSLAERTQALVDAYTLIARTRMAGLPLLNPALAVEAVGFAPQADAPDEPGALGVLITPWFMNLVWLPQQRDERHGGIGHAQTRVIGGQPLAFIGGHEQAVGAFGACSLFSPVFEFPSPADARATALAVLAQLRPAPVPEATPAQALPQPQMPARRGFLLGRSAVHTPPSPRTRA
jgi:[NiFe] hydrogenase assembly HybE family chaperone